MNNFVYKMGELLTFLSLWRVTREVYREVEQPILRTDFINGL